MNWHPHIVATPDTCTGKPRVKGTRITVELLLNCMAAGYPESRILEEYPQLSAEQIRAAVAFASMRVGSDSTLAGLEAAA